MLAFADEVRMNSNGLLHMNILVLADQQKLTFIISVRTLGVV